MPRTHRGVPDQIALCWSTSVPSTRYRQRGVGTQAVGPGLHGLMVDDMTGIHIGQSLTGQAAALLFLIEPGGQGLLDDPVPGTLQAIGNFIDALSQFNGDMRSEERRVGKEGEDGRARGQSEE